MPMAFRHIPKLCTVPKIEQITTPNKNIQSYFMRTDASHYVDERFKMNSYRSDEQIVQVVLSNNRLLVESTENAVDLGDAFRLTSFNTDRFGSLEECVGWIGSEVEGVLRRTGIVSRDSFVSLVFQDLLNRTEVLALCNAFVNVMSFRGILVTPFSLSQAIATLSPNCVVINLYESHSTVCFVEDFWMLDAISVSKTANAGFSLADSEDFVDEFNRIKVFEEKNVFLCEECDYKDDSEEKVLGHILGMHLGDLRCHVGLGDAAHAGLHARRYEQTSGCVCEAMINRMAYAFSREKIRRIGSKIIVTRHCDADVSEDVLRHAFRRYDVQPEIVFAEATEELVLSGMATFADLECARDMWMTDREWNSAGLRILKEKVLFII